MKKLPMLLIVLIAGVLALVACVAGETAAPVPVNTPLPQAPTFNDTSSSQPELAAAESTEAVTEDPAPETEEMAEAETATSEDMSSDEEASGEAGMEKTEGESASVEEVILEESEAASAVRTFVIVPAESKASYIVAEEFFGGALDRLGIQPGLVDTIGSTQEVTGEMQLDLSDPSSPLVSNQFVVNLRSLTSDQSRRDQRIRSANLESDRFPLANFTITSLEGAPEVYNEGEEVVFKAIGEITIREITQPATFDITAKLEGDTITGVATTRLKMTDFGFEPPNFANVFSVANDFTAQVEFTFQGQ